MKAVFHVGMSKTGTSSIQRTFLHYQHPDIFYPGGGLENKKDIKGSGNHSKLTVLLFNKHPEKNPGFKARGYTPEEIEKLRQDTQRELIKSVRKSSKNTCLISSEQISSMPFGICGKVRNFGAKHFDDHEVIAYVRPPISYMTSVFQQRLKGNLSTLELVWPNYRHQLEKLDKVFGRDKVTLRKFDRKTLHNGDVVSDIGQFLGIEIPKTKIIRHNESLSLEAIALLFVQRKYGQGFEQGSQSAIRRNYQFMESLGTLGKQKLQFDDSLFAPLIEENREDLEWIEERLGVKVLDNEQKSGFKVSSMNDFLDIAWESNKLLIDHLLAAISEAEDGDLMSLIQNVELFRSFASHLPKSTAAMAALESVKAADLKAEISARASQALYAKGPTDGPPDNLKKIEAIGPKLETLINSKGVYYFRQIAAWSVSDVEAVEDAIGSFRGRIARDNWIEQAKALAKG